MVVDGCLRSAQPAFVPSHLSAASQTPAEARQIVPALPGVKTHVPTRLPGVPDTSQVSFVQTSLSLQTFVAHGFRSVVTTRSVQSHFDPVPAC